MQSTYRVQFHKNFTFRDATQIVPYLSDLGITHLYASPYLKATPGSTHGYDVIDHCQLNPEVGTEADYRAFVAALKNRGMSHILDTVPNHVGVATNENTWWNRMLEEGPNGEFGKYFDIDWDGSPRAELHGKVLLPVLGASYGETLEKGELRLVRDGRKLFVSYYDRRFPIDPKTAGEVGDDLTKINGTPGDADSFDALDALLNRQHYRLSDWQVASDEINYRRFFDVNSLAALSMERQEVFDATHALTFKLLADGSVAGLRIDHPDGLYDPAQYFERLQAKYVADVDPKADAATRPLWVSVEKILNGDEQLPTSWAMHGTSGYDALCAINDLYVVGQNEQAFSALYSKWVDNCTPFAEWVYQKKSLVLNTSLASELNMLAHRLDRLAQANRRSRDFTLRSLRDGLREVIACFAVYRTYISSAGMSDHDMATVEAAVEKAKSRNPRTPAALFDFIRDTVLLRYPVAEADKAAQLRFAGKFQQVTSPATAKGIEDTTFYIYNRLASLNEVGGDPGRFGRDPAAIHRYFSDRQTQWPTALNPLSTHDTKRSEDVRARISVLSEIPDEWAACLQRWAKLNEPLLSQVDGSPAPSRNDQYLIYQTLLGAWPIDGDTGPVFVERIQAYLEKAMREAKVHTAWTAQNAAYEAAANAFIGGMIDPTKSRAFLDDFVPFQKRISHFGLLNSLSQTLLRLAAPGVPDTYQGTELWDFSLVDPDNRRPVDYAARRDLLPLVRDASAAALFAAKDDGRIKMFVTHKALVARRAHPKLFTGGEYVPLELTGTYAEHVFAFLRRDGDQAALVAVPRLLTGVSSSPSAAPVGAPWKETEIALPAGVPPLTDVFTGRKFAVGSSVAVAELFATLPLALCISG